MTGFTDGEGSFTLTVRKSSKLTCGWESSACFAIGVDKKDKDLLNAVQAYFGVGQVAKGEKNVYRYQVRKLNDLNIIIDHFNKYPLITQKHSNFELFKKAVEMFSNKEHLTLDGIHKLISIKTAMNLGLSPDLKAAFPNIESYPKPFVKDQKIRNPYWVSGFTSAEGCFYIRLKNKPSGGHYVSLSFKITQHSKDELLLKSFITYLGCGWFENQKGDWGNFACSNITEINDKIIPFFNKYPPVGLKFLNYMDGCKAAKIIKDHLTTEGLEKILKIKAGMNNSRDFN